MTMASNETIKQAVMANMGLSFLSLHTTGLEVQSGLLKVLEVDGLPLVRRWQVVHVRTRLLSPAAEALRYYVLEHGEPLLAKMFAGLAEPRRTQAAPQRKPSPRARRGERAR